MHVRYGCPLQADIPVSGMMTKLQECYPERRDELVKLLGIDINWRMHQVRNYVDNPALLTHCC
jgi:ABC-type uncharacterized transport system ATPase subunit